LNRRVVVTGIGLICGAGNVKEEVWSNLLAGVSRVGPITRFETSNFPVRIASEVQNFDPLSFIEKKEIKKMDPFIHYAVAAAQLAVRDARLDVPLAAPDRCGVLVGVGIGGRVEVGGRIVAGGDRGAQAGDVDLLGQEVGAQVIALRRIDGRVELDQHLARTDRLSVLHPDGAHDAGLERLHHLAATARHDLARRGRDDVDLAPGGPGQRGAEEKHDGRRDDPPGRRRRRLDDLERGGQERELVAAPRMLAPQRNHARLGACPECCFRRLHGDLPAGDAAPRSGHRSGPARRGCRPRPAGRARS